MEKGLSSQSHQPDRTFLYTAREVIDIKYSEYVALIIVIPSFDYPCATSRINLRETSVKNNRLTVPIDSLSSHVVSSYIMSAMLFIPGRSYAVYFLDPKLLGYALRVHLLAISAIRDTYLLP